MVRTNISQSCMEIRAYMNYLEHGALFCLRPRSNRFLILIRDRNQSPKVQDIASDIGRRIEEEIWFEFEQRRLDPDDAAQMRKEASMPGSSPHYRNVAPSKLQRRRHQRKDCRLLTVGCQRIEQELVCTCWR